MDFFASHTEIRLLNLFFLNFFIAFFISLIVLNGAVISRSTQILKDLLKYFSDSR